MAVSDRVRRRDQECTRTESRTDLSIQIKMENRIGKGLFHVYDVYHLFVWELAMSVVGQCLTNVCCFFFECTVIAHSCLLCSSGNLVDNLFAPFEHIWRQSSRTEYPVRRFAEENGRFGE